MPFVSTYLCLHLHGKNSLEQDGQIPDFYLNTSVWLVLVHYSFQEIGDNGIPLIIYNRLLGIHDIYKNILGTHWGEGRRQKGQISLACAWNNKYRRLD